MAASPRSGICVPELAVSKRVVYSKWLGGRATFFSRDLFRSMLALRRAGGDLHARLSRPARTLLDVLSDDSPQGTGSAPRECESRRRGERGEYTRAMRVLWERLLVVGVGEREEGGFPSLAVGATELLFEDLWNAAAIVGKGDAETVARFELSSPSFARTWQRLSKKTANRDTP